MPEKKVIKAVVCPMCGELGKAEIYTSVNATVNREQRDKVLDGELFAWKCSSTVSHCVKRDSTNGQRKEASRTSANRVRKRERISGTASRAFNGS